MPADSPAMGHFRANVLAMISDTGSSISALTEQMNALRRKKKQALVSRTFVSNLLHGHRDCSIPFAEEIATALRKPLSELLETPEKILN